MLWTRLDPGNPHPWYHAADRMVQETYLLDFPACHRSTFINDKDHILGHCRKVLRGKVVHKITVLNL